jgi:acyl carrier protein
VEEVRDQILTFFAERGLRRDDPDVGEIAYLDAGLLDSMGVVMMIAEFEETFEIRFTSDDLQSEDFVTIGGLIRKIEQVRAQSR